MNEEKRLEIRITCGDPEEPCVYDFVCRIPTPSECADFLDKNVKATSINDTINLVIAITKSVNGQSGANAIALINEMAKAGDGFEIIANDALLAAGYPNPRRMRSLVLRANTSQDDLEKMGLPGNILELKQTYKPPRQLKAIQFDGFPTVVMVTPSVADIEAKDKTARTSAVRALADLGASCAVWPALDARLEIWKAHPGLSFQLGSEATEMREAIKGAEKKG